MSEGPPLVRLRSTTGGTIYDQVTGRDLLTFDASVLEQHDRSSTTTDHPVEDGSAITDHVQLDPITLTVIGIISATPLSATIEEEQDRDWITWDELVRLWKNAVLLTVATARLDYEDMVIVGLSDADAEGVAQWIEVTITLRQIQTVAARTVELPPEQMDARVRHNAPGNRNTGRQAQAKASDTDAAGEQRSKSVLASLADSML